jgi:hypothetical protein
MFVSWRSRVTAGWNVKTAKQGPHTLLSQTDPDDHPALCVAPASAAALAPSSIVASNGPPQPPQPCEPRAVPASNVKAESVKVRRTSTGGARGIIQPICTNDTPSCASTAPGLHSVRSRDGELELRGGPSGTDLRAIKNVVDAQLRAEASASRHLTADADTVDQLRLLAPWRAQLAVR